MVIQGKMRSAVRVETSCNGGGIHSPEDADTKSGWLLIDVLSDKYPPMMDSNTKANE